MLVDQNPGGTLLGQTSYPNPDTLPKPAMGNNVAQLRWDQLVGSVVWVTSSRNQAYCLCQVQASLYGKTDSPRLSRFTFILEWEGPTWNSAPQRLYPSWVHSDRTPPLLQKQLSTNSGRSSHTEWPVVMLFPMPAVYLCLLQTVFGVSHVCLGAASSGCRHAFSLRLVMLSQQGKEDNLDVWRQ